VWVAAAEHLSPAAEQDRYARHHNAATDSGYVAYLSAVVDTVLAVAGPELGPTLDFGCGEHAVLTGLLRRRGIDCTPYDPLYGIGGDAPGRTYRTIVACEVVEHFRDPRAEFARLGRLLAPGGRLVIRTGLVTPAVDLATWWYARDPTHIAFYRVETIDAAARSLGLQRTWTDRREYVVLAAGC
jgi:hypothetical protein